MSFPKSSVCQIWSSELAFGQSLHPYR